MAKNHWKEPHQVAISSKRTKICYFLATSRSESFKLQVIIKLRVVFGNQKDKNGIEMAQEDYMSFGHNRRTTNDTM